MIDFIINNYRQRRSLTVDDCGKDIACNVSFLEKVIDGNVPDGVSVLDLTGSSEKTNEQRLVFFY